MSPVLTTLAFHRQLKLTVKEPTKTKSEFLPAMSLQIILMSVLVLCMTTTLSSAQQSVARQWNEMLLHAIRLDFARPTIHA
jgi:hypothetical protein